MSTLQVATMQEKPYVLCQPCLDRFKESPAKHVVGSDPWCDGCFYGGSSEIAILNKSKAAKTAPARIERLKQKAVNDTFIQPFMELIDHKVCARCPEPAQTNHAYCKACRTKVWAVSKSRAWLRSFRKTGNRKSMAAAVSHIRKHNLTVEDFKKY